MWTNEEEIIEKAEKIKEKKVIFTGKNIQKDYVVYLDPARYLLGNKQDMEVGAAAHRMNACASGKLKKYNIFDLLLFGTVRETERIG